MAGYYGYRRGRYYRRGYRRWYRRYGGSSLRRYRSVQMNDNETKVMTFSSVYDAQLTLSSGAGTYTLFPSYLLNGSTTTDGSVGPSAGRAFFAGMMFDRLRFRSVSVTIRPKIMPSASATNYLVYAAWDRYGTVYSGASETAYSIRSDPSAKQVVWTPGGSGSPLRTWIYSTARDRYQYLPIKHSADLTSWSFPISTDIQAQFAPILLIAVEAITADSSPVQFSIHSRLTIEFQGGFSNTTLNYTPSASGLAAAKNAVTPEEIPNSQPDGSSQYLAQQFQRMQTSLPTISRR